MKVLAIGAHPDDIALSCSGTLMKYQNRGDEVYICTISDGRYGSTEIEPDNLANARYYEDSKVAEIICNQFEHYFNLGIHDQFVDSNNVKDVDKLVKVIQLVKPDLIITHAPNDYHRDHQETYRLVFRATCAASLYFWNKGGDTPICPIYLMDSFALKNFEPTEYVDISDVIEEKQDLMPIYKSQYNWMKEHDGLDLCEYVEDCAKVRGYQCGVDYAEGFRPDENYGRMSTIRLLP